MIKILVLAVFCSLPWDSFAKELIIDFSTISEKSKTDLIDIVGEPSICLRQFEEDIEKCNFKDDQIQIYFVSGLSDWITIGKLEGYDFPYSIESIKHIGLDPESDSSPTPQGGNIVFYEPYLKYRSIMLGKGDSGKLGFISVKVNTLNYGKFTSLGNLTPEQEEFKKRFEEAQSMLKSLRTKLRDAE